MCGCVADKSAVNAQQRKEMEAKANQGAICSCGTIFKEGDTRCQTCGKNRIQERRDPESQASDGGPALPPEEGDLIEEVPDRGPDPMTLETLEEALIGSLQVDLQQLKVLRRWWKALGLGTELPREPLEVSLDGDGSALELAVAVSPELVLSIIPTLLALVPDGVPSPPSAKYASGKRLEKEPIHFSTPPLNLEVEAPAQPSRRFFKEAQLLAPAPETLGSWRGDGDVLPTKVSDGGRPRGKAKAKSRVQRLDDDGLQGLNGQVVPTVVGAETVKTPEKTPIIPEMQLEANMESKSPDTSNVTPLPLVLERDASKEQSAKVLEPVAELEPLGQTPIGKLDKDYTDIPGEYVRDPPPSEQYISHPTPARAAKNEPLRKPDVESVRMPVYDDSPRHGDVDVNAAARQWREALQRAIAELCSSCVVIWLHLGGLGLPRGVPRPVDVGVRIQTEPNKETFGLVNAYQDVAESFEESGITSENGWMVTEMGCSLFAHGPLVSFSAEGRERDMRCDMLLEKVSPPSLRSEVKNLAYGRGIRTGVRAGLKNGDILLGACFQLLQASKVRSPGMDLQSLAVDFALGKEKLFDAFLLERVRQTIVSLGGISEVSAIECRANDLALVTLQISPCSDDGRHSA